MKFRWYYPGNLLKSSIGLRCRADPLVRKRPPWSRRVRMRLTSTRLSIPLSFDGAFEEANSVTADLHPIAIVSTPQFPAALRNL